MARISERLAIESSPSPLEDLREDMMNLALSKATSPILEIHTVPGRGRGLFAITDIPRGNLIADDFPLFTLPNIDLFPATEETLLLKVRALPATQQREFHTLYNNYVEHETPTVGIVRTNVLGISPEVDAIYPLFSFLNHSCVPNAHYSWNSNLQKGTLFAIEEIPRGGEITMGYGGHQRGRPDFECSCALCSLWPPARYRSDYARSMITALRTQIINRVAIQHESSLDDLQEMESMLWEVYGQSSGIAFAWVYFTASEVAASQSDLARAHVFAERAYEARLLCEGKEHPIVMTYCRVKDDLSLHERYRSTDFRETSVDMLPLNMGEAEFEEWLWNWE